MTVRPLLIAVAALLFSYSLSSAQTDTFTVESTSPGCVQQGDTFWLYYTAKESISAFSFQYSLIWDQSELELIAGPVLFKLDQFGTTNTGSSDSTVNLLAFSINSLNIMAGDTLWAIQLATLSTPAPDFEVQVHNDPVPELLVSIIPEEEATVLPAVGTTINTINGDAGPRALCKDVEVLLLSGDTVTIPPSEINDGSNDPCKMSPLTFSLMPNMFTEQDSGQNNVVLTVTDTSGLSDTCQATVTIEVYQPVEAICQDITIYLDSTGMATITPADVDGGSTGTGPLTYSIDKSTFGMSDEGLNNVTLTVMDTLMGADSCMAEVNVLDTFPEPPITFTINSNAPNCVQAGDSFWLYYIAGDSLTAFSFQYSLYWNPTEMELVNGPELFKLNDFGSPLAASSDSTAAVSAFSGNSVDIFPGDTLWGIQMVALSTPAPNFEVEVWDDPVPEALISFFPMEVEAIVMPGVGEVINSIGGDYLPTAICQDITVDLIPGDTFVLDPAQVDGGSFDDCQSVNPTLSVSPNTFVIADTGVNVVVLTATDTLGNSDTCLANVTIERLDGPKVICNDITVHLDTLGAVTITPADIDGGSTGSGPLTFALDRDSFSCANVGANSVILSVTDSIATNTCEATVTVLDTLLPEVECLNSLTAYLDANGEVVVQVGDVLLNATDNCSLSFSLPDTLYGCEDIGNQVVFLDVEDDGGNTVTCGISLTIADTIAPQINCSDQTVYLDTAGTANITASEVSPVISENCGMPTVTLSTSQFSCGDIGTQSVMLMASDTNGNTSSCTIQVTVIDSIQPEVTCQNDTVYLGTNGQVPVGAGNFISATGDNCGTTLTALPPVLGCDQLGQTPVLFTLTDISGNMDTCSSIATVLDTLPPTAICKNGAIQLDQNGLAILDPSVVNDNSFDNCDIVDTEVFPDTFTINEVGPNTVTLVVFDQGGLTDSCDATVTVQPPGAGPLAICKDATVFLNASGSAFLQPAQVDGGSVGEEPLTFFVSPSIFNCSNLGPNVVTLTVTDIDDEQDTCQATVTVADTLPPSLVCDTIAIDLDGNGMASLDPMDLPVNASDNCGGIMLSSSQTMFDCTDRGTVLVTAIGTDFSNNSDSCEVVVQVIDPVPPQANCTDITVSLDTSGIATPDPAAAGAGSVDNCGELIFQLNPGTFDCNQLGVNPAQVIVTDSSGNSSGCSVNITVEDNEAPTAVCKASVPLFLDENGVGSLSAAMVDDGSSDNCELNLSVAPGQFTCNDIGNQQVVLTVIDAAGNTDDCVAQVQVQDTLSPDVVCNDIIVQLDTFGMATVMPTQVGTGSTDNCGITNFTLMPNMFDTMDLGPNVVTLTASDASMNTASCTATVTVIEFNAAPIANCKDATVTIGPDGTVTIPPSVVDNGSTAAGIMLSVSPNVFTCEEIGPNTVTLTVTDALGQTDECTATVTVIDDQLPTAVCDNVEVFLDEQGVGVLTFADIDGGSEDNCGIATTDLSQSNFTCANIGTTTVVLTVGDESGNTATCTASVSVEDKEPPVLDCQDVTVNIAPGGNVTVPVGQVASASDNCNTVTLSPAQFDFDCSDLGNNNVVVTATDGQGNNSTCPVTIRVNDPPSGTLACKNTSVSLGPNGSVTIGIDDVTSFLPQDVCGNLTTNISPSFFDCSDIGLNVVAVTVTNTNNGQDIATCTAQVVVQDNSSPQANCKDITINLDGNGEAMVTPAEVDDNSTDNCGITSFNLSPNMFDCADAGTTVQAVLTVTDAANNSDQCISNITVSGSGAINAQCKDITLQLDNQGNANLFPFQIDDGSSASCGMVTLSVDPTAFDCDDIGQNIATLTVTTSGNNSATCTSVVTVEDNVAPIVTCNDVTVELNQNGEVVLNAADFLDSINTFDNCDETLPPVSIFPTTLNCGDLGENLVVVNVVDDSGNENSCAGTAFVEPGNVNLPNITFAVQDESAPGAMDGSIFAVINGGSGAFDLMWDFNNSSANPLQNLSAGTYCITVTDLNNDCEVSNCGVVNVDSNIIYELSGRIYTEVNQNVNLVNVRQFGPPVDSMTTGPNGLYTVDAQLGSNALIDPRKNINPKNGVATFDLVLIAQHILQVAPLTGPYKLIAADANNDAKITNFDILELRKIILEIVTELPDVDSWRFVPADYNFPNPNNPWMPPFPETIQVNNVSSDQSGLDFIGIKIGDVDNSLNPLLISAGPKQAPLQLVADDQILESGTQLEVPIFAENFKQILGYQMTIDFDTELLDLVDIVPGQLPRLDASGFGFTRLSEGMIAANWFDAYPQDLDPETPLFTLVFEARQSGSTLSKGLTFNSALLQREAYRTEGKAGLELTFRGADNPQDQVRFYDPVPNPFRTYTDVALESPTGENVRLRIVDASGQQIAYYEQQVEAGYQVLRIPAEVLPAQGMYFYRIECGEYAQSGKLIHLR